jgi:hypothetical protein
MYFLDDAIGWMKYADALSNNGRLFDCHALEKA